MTDVSAPDSNGSEELLAEVQFLDPSTLHSPEVFDGEILGLSIEP